MNTDIEKMLKDAETNKKALNHLKQASIETQNFVAGAIFRDIERQNFPKTKQETDAHILGSELNRLFRMCDLNIDDKICYIIFTAFEKYKKKKGNFDLKDACKIKADADKYFIR